MLWNDVSRLFEVDGSLRDILIFGTTVSDWDTLIQLALRLGKVSFELDSERAELPSSVKNVFAQTEHARCMKIDLGGPFVNTHFFSADEIELDLDPREINSQTDLDAVLGFCAQLGSELERDVVITEENTPEAVLLRYSSRMNRWEIIAH